MADMVTIDGQQYKKRNPLGVLGLSFRRMVPGIGAPSFS
jgi:hypothetical protein